VLPAWIQTPPMSTEYTLTDWLIDVMEHGLCQSCGNFGLERMGDFEAQCYRCGKWHSGYDLGRSHTELLHLSTQYDRQRQRNYHKNKYEDGHSMRFEQELMDYPELPTDIDDFT